MSIFNPCPLPLLAPRVDLRGVTSIGSTSISGGLYRSIYHALGARYNSASLFSTTYRCGLDSNGRFYYGRGSSFSGYASSTSLTGFPTSSTSSTQHGGYYTISGSADVSTERTSGTSSTVYLGSSYTVSVFSLDTFFAGQEYYLRAATMIDTTDAKMQTLRDQPYNFDFAKDPLYFTSTVTSDYFAKLPLWQDVAFGARYAFPVMFAPSRPLQSTPNLIEEERVNQLVSISGLKSFRVSYAKRRIYEVKLLLDGAASRASNPRRFSPLLLWDDFLKWADAGVTLWIDRGWLSCFWRPQRAVVCPDMPNEITGALLDASSLSFAPRDGIPDAYEVTIQIADESGKLGYINGAVPER